MINEVIWLFSKLIITELRNQQLKKKHVPVPSSHAQLVSAFQGPTDVTEMKIVRTTEN